MRNLPFIVLLLLGLSAQAQQTQVIEYGYNPRGELHIIIQDNDTLINFYDASGNRITESQNIYSIDDLEDPKGDHFLQCYPNPAADEITVAFILPREMDYQITLFNQSGQFQKQVVSEKQTSGKKQVKVSLAGKASGVYYIWFNSKEISKVKKVIRR
jgi:hypothetical protein